MKAGKMVLNLVKIGSGVVAGACLGAYVTGKSNETRRELTEASRDKFKSYYDITREWMICEMNGHNIADWISDNGINKMAVYGAGTMGDLFYETMKNSEEKIAFFVEETGAPLSEFKGNTALETLEYGVDWEGLDMVIVTAVTYFKDIKAKLEELGVSCPIVSLEEIVYSLGKEK